MPEGGRAGDDEPADDDAARDADGDRLAGDPEPDVDDWRHYSDGEGDAPGDGEGDAPGDGEGDAPGDGEGDAPGDGEEDAPGADSEDRDAPLGDLAEEVRRRRERADAGRVGGGGGPGDKGDRLDAAGGRAGADAGEPFEEMSYADVDADDVWEAIDGDEAATGPVAVGDPVEEAAGGRDVRVIPKRTCETCQYLSEPPAVRCTHDGTDILELADVDHHKVADCPMVTDEFFDGRDRENPRDR